MKQIMLQDEKEAQLESQKLRLALLTLQKQMQLLKLREALLIMTFTLGGVLGRALIHGFSVEPITFIAILTGWLFGSKKGFLVGASSVFYPISL